MEIKQKKRSEIKDKYKWDLSSIYSSEKEIESDFDNAKELSEKIVSLKEKEIKNSSDLIEILDLDIKLGRVLDKLIIYSRLKLSEDASNNESQELYGKVMNLATKISTDTSFMTNKILKIDDKIMNKILCDDDIKEYKFFLENLLKQKKHSLSDDEEKLISKLSKSLMLDEEIYDKLTNVDMKFGFIKDEEGNNVELTNSNYSIFLMSKDRKIREEAFKKFYGTFGNYTNTISGIYNSHLETNAMMCELRRYDSILDSDLENDNLPKGVYSNLINTINDNIGVLHRYYSSKKKILNLDDAHIYDLSAPIFSDDKNYSFEDARNLILDIFKLLGDDYLQILNKAFNERWIDVYNNEGKTFGAFSSGVYDSNPYVLMNYEGKIYDVSSLSHELGHSVHKYFSKNNNSYLYYDYSLFTAEVASLTNEIIFNTKMIEREKDEKSKFNIINNLIRTFNSNLFGACMDAEFELDVHEKIENGEVLTSDYFNNLYLKLNQKYYGSDIMVDDEIKYRWEIYSHLYSDYYLFKYSTGISCASFCASKILSGDEVFIEKYKNFLKLGGSMYPSDALKTIGIDITNKEFIEYAIKFYDDLVSKLITTFNKINN